MAIKSKNKTAKKSQEKNVKKRAFFFSTLNRTVWASSLEEAQKIVSK